MMKVASESSHQIRHYIVCARASNKSKCSEMKAVVILLGDKRKPQHVSLKISGLCQSRAI